MSELDRQIVRTRRRLWLNRGLRLWGWCLTICSGLWLGAWIADRLFALRWPMGWAALIGLAASAAAAVVWLLLTRERELAAAVALDEAAGLRERASTGLSVRTGDSDPFAAAVLVDAEAHVAGITPGKLIPLRWDRSLNWGIMVVVVAAFSLFLPEFDLLNRSQSAAEAMAQNVALNRVRNIVAPPVNALSQIAEKHGDEELAKELKSLEDALKPDVKTDADVLRREAIKKLDKLQESLKSKAAEEKFKALDETKKRLQKLSEMQDDKSPLGKLIDAMAGGEFAEAQKAVEQLKEDLARRVREGKLDPRQAEQMRQKLNEIAQKMQQAAQDQQSRREMQNAGLSQQDIERVLQTLAKKDPKQIEKLAQELAERLKGQGASAEQMKEMMEKIAARQQSGQRLNEMAEKMAGAAQMLEQGNMEGLQSELGEAGEMLNEMEMMEQALNELEGQMSQLDDARQNLGDGEGEGGDQGNCKQCNGTGFRKDGAPCPHCNGTGQGRNGGGRAFGARDRDDNVSVGFRNTKAPIKTGRDGRIIGRQFVKGQPLAGKSQVEFYDAATAAEIDATDALNRERIPRAYRKGVREYFDRLGESFRPETGESKADKPEPDAK